MWSYSIHSIIITLFITAIKVIYQDNEFNFRKNPAFYRQSGNYPFNTNKLDNQ